MRAPFIIDIRPTKRCNARCTYCSANASPDSPRMSVEEFRRGLEFIFSDVLPTIGIGGDRKVRFNWMGGELLTVPERDLREMVWLATSLGESHFETVTHYAQSNLIGSEARVKNLYALFGGEIGTTVDRFTDQRTVGGSADRYRQILDRNRVMLRNRRGGFIPEILILDRNSIGHVAEEVALAEKNGIGLDLRPVFSMNGEGDTLSPGEIADVLVAEYRKWVLQGRTLLCTIHPLLGQVLAVAGGHSEEVSTGCPNQRDCAGRNLCLEADGDLFVCFGLSDFGYGRLGNAFRGEFDQDAWRRMSAAGEAPLECLNCEAFRFCRGGCMADAVRFGSDPSARNPLCPVWRGLIEAMVCTIDTYGYEAVRAWYMGLDQGLIDADDKEVLRRCA